MVKSHEQKSSEGLLLRPPVVVVLGHVDHGKTTLLNAIRQLEFTGEKPGGIITQHIGAFEVEEGGKRITFIDTPGHEAFSIMRSRGALVADIAVLVVAADEGVKAQTKEAIAHIKKAGLPLIVALNKVDKPEANPEKVKGELAKNDVVVESMGGKVPSVETSAKTKKGISELLDLILLVAEMEGLKADLDKPGQGTIIEAYLDRKRGPTATVIVRDGILLKGDIIATPSTIGKVRILENFQGEDIEKVFPSMPAVVLGFESVPRVGEKFEVFKNVEEAQRYLAKKERKFDQREVFVAEAGKKILNIILKADVLGSLEAIEAMLKNLPQDKVALRILKGEVGDIKEEDLKLAQSSKAKIIGFRVKFPASLQRLAERQNIKVMIFDIIYELIQGVRKIMERLTASEKVRVDFGRFKVTIVFKTEKDRQIIGGKVLEGQIKKGLLVDVERKEENVGRGKIINLQKEKKDIETAKKGEEVGILYEGDVKIEEGDILLLYTYGREKNSEA